LKPKSLNFQRIRKYYWNIKDKNRQNKKDFFDKVIITLPSFLFIKIAPQLPQDYIQQLKQLKGLGATNLGFKTQKPFLMMALIGLTSAIKMLPVMAIVRTYKLYG